MSNTLISLQRLTAPAAVILSTAWVTTQRGLGDGFWFLLMVGFFYIALVFIEWQIYCDNHYNGRH